MTNEMSIIDIKNPIEVFSKENGLDPIIDKIESDAKSIDRDISTHQGRDNIRAIAFKIAKSKTAIDKMGKDLTEEQRIQINAVNKERSRAWDRMERLQDEIRKPLTDWEDAEKDRVQEHNNALSDMAALSPHDLLNPSSEDIQSRIDALGNMPIRNWQEFEVRAVNTRKEIADHLIKVLHAAQKRESDAAEIARLRAAEDARQQKERDDKIAADVAAKAKKEAEEKAAADAAAASKKADEEKADLIRKAEAEKAESDKAAIEAKAALDKAAADKIAADKKAADDAAAAEEKRLRDIKGAEERSAKAERDRLQNIANAEAAEKARRESDTAHKAAINNEALSAMRSIFDEFYGEDSTHVIKALLKAIANGKITHVSIKY